MAILPRGRTLTAFGLIVTALTATASADTYQHLDHLALRIDRQAKQIVSETRHYRHTPEYRHLVADARQLCRLADHIHELAHHHGSVAHIASDLAQLDSEFHHLESLFDRIQWRAAHGQGHVHGNTGHVKELLISIEEDIHHMQEDLRALQTGSHPYATSQLGFRGGYYGNAPSHGWRDDRRFRSPGRGITIGGGSSRLTIRF